MAVLSDMSVGLFIGGLLVLLGILFSVKPGKYGSGTGISTPHAKKSRENWDYAQKNGPIVLIRCGIVNMILTILAVILCAIAGVENIKIYFALTGAISVCVFLFCMVKIDRAVVKFEKDNQTKTG